MGRGEIKDNKGGEFKYDILYILQEPLKIHNVPPPSKNKIK
jgi:hypothetical protein